MRVRPAPRRGLPRGAEYLADPVLRELEQIARRREHHPLEAGRWQQRGAVDCRVAAIAGVSGGDTKWGVEYDLELHRHHRARDSAPATRAILSAGAGPERNGAKIASRPSRRPCSRSRAADTSGRSTSTRRSRLALPDGSMSVRSVV